MAEEEGVNEEYEAMLDPAEIRPSKAVVTVRADTRPRTRARAASRQPSRLTFGAVDSSALGGVPSPKKGPIPVALTLDNVDMVATKISSPLSPIRETRLR